VFAKVVLREATRSFDREYTYAVPDAMAGALAPGFRVLVPFGSGDRKVEAYVMAVSRQETSDFYVKPVAALLDEAAVLRPDQLRLAAHMRRRYACTYGDALQCMIPAGIAVRTERFAERMPGAVVPPMGDEDEADAAVARAVVEVLAAAPKGRMTEEALLLAAGIPRVTLLRLEKAGVVRLFEKSGQAVKAKTVRTVYAVDPEAVADLMEEGRIGRINQYRILEMVLEFGECLVEDVLTACQTTKATLKTLVDKGMLAYGTAEARRSGDVPEALPEPDEDKEPTPGQTAAVRELTRAVVDSACGNDAAREFLLHGITGSGKTEVYLQVARRTLDEGRSVLILVPEIALTPQMVHRIQSRFGDEVAVLHSRLTPVERYGQWRRVLDGEVRLVVGARSGIFAPLANLGLVVVDEEQESSYKSETHPRYHAIDIARFRCHDSCAVLLLGSATPSVESYHRTVTGQSRLLRITERPGGARLPEVTVVDMREELAAGNRSVFSRPLRALLYEAFREKHQAMLFLNRRGHSSFFLCYDCGKTVRCRNCSVSLTFHAVVGTHSGPSDGLLVCHYCGRATPLPQQCPSCGSARGIGRMGVGTQQIEEIFHREYPDRTILRMDQDTTTGRLSHGAILDRFRDERIDALVGTQMIAKGHDFANVTVVGILAADLMLGMSDFRASERAFQLLVQASGRAGRGEDPGKVVIQAYNVDDYAVRCAKDQDFEGFFAKETAFRKAMGYPPFGSVGIVTLSSKNSAASFDAARDVAAMLRGRCSEEEAFAGVVVSDAGKAPMFKLRDRFRHRVVVKAPAAATLASLFETVADAGVFKECVLSLDVDPYNLL
jgi:primosomal protein N' (replication factor Y)